MKNKSINTMHSRNQIWIKPSIYKTIAFDLNENKNFI